MTFIIEQTQLDTIFVEAEGVSKIVKNKSLKTVKTLITDREVTDEDRNDCEKAGIKLYTLADLIEKGLEHKAKQPTNPTASVSPKDTYIVM